MNLKTLTLKKLINNILFIGLIFANFQAKAQCSLNLFANPDPVLCGECVTLSAFGSMDGNVAFQEDFNSGSPVGWQFTQATTIATNTCGVPSPDGTPFMWMGDASVNPRDMTTVGFDLTLGGTICFEMRYSKQGDASPCEGPDEPDEGVFLQYSTNGGTTWQTIEYWDPNGGNDASLTSWNQYCVTIPAGAMTANTMIQWHQNAVSGAEYDHWGIDNVIITLNDPNSQISWLHDGYNYPLGSGGGDNPTQVCISTPTTYSAQITNGTNTCTQNITVHVVNPVLEVTADADASVCPGDCIQLTGESKVIISPASTPTFTNAEFSVVFGGSADMNINVTGLNQTTLTSSSITEVCLTSFNFSGTQVCAALPPPFGPGTCPCNGGTINNGQNCNLDVSSFDVILTTPDGCQITLVPNGVATGTNYTNVCFVPSGGGNINGGGFPAAGSWNPSQPFSNLNGCDANGVWNLEVNAPGGLGFGFGTLQGWSITFDDPEISYPASYTWSPTTDMTNSTTLTPTVCPTATQTYTLTATDSNNCVTVSDNVTITVSSCTSCSIDALTADTSSCNSATNTYSLTGNITFSNPPATGTLTVTSSCGGSQTFNAPFTSPQAYNISGITSNGAACSVTAVFSADAGCTRTSNYTAPAACTPTCIITNFTAFQDFCENPLNVYDVTGSVTFSNAPATGTLTVSSCSGQSQVFNAPFASPINYMLNNLPADGAACSVTAVFSADATCTQTINFTNQNPCDVPCAFTSITDTIGACDLATNDFIRSGQVTFTNAPSTGTLTITDCLGNTQTFNPPFTSPTSYSLTINSNGTTNCDITATFSSDPACTINIAQDYPVSCACPADAGTSSAGVFGNGLNDYILCSGDTIIIVSDGNETNPNDVGVIGTSTYDPGITYGIYTCPPTPNTNPELDPCFTGFITGTIGSFGDINDGGLLAFLAGYGITFTNNIVYFAPITLYNQDSLVYNVNCVDVGSPIAVQYLPEVTSSLPTENCAAGTFTVTINGGLPQLDGSSFTASNLLPATASFVNTTTTNGGTIQITGLQHGDNYSFDVADANGCPITITGGPFTGAPVADAGQNDTSCTLTYTLNASLSHGTGQWTGPANISFSDATSPTATATSTTTGTYTLTWTGTSLPGCTDAATVNITFTQMSTPVTPVNVSCNGGSDGQITVAPQGGIPPYSYAWSTSTNTTPLETNLSAGTVTVTVTDAAGCSADSTITITEPAAFGLSITNTTNVTCKSGNDGAATASVSDITDTYTYSWNTTPVQATASATALTAGTYTVIATQVSSGCTDTTTVTITEPDSVSITTISSNDTICSGQSTTLTATATGGSGSGYVYTWNNGLGAGQNQTVTPAANTSTTYTVTAVDANGCPSNSKSVTVTVHPNLTVVASADNTICPGTSATISATPAGGNGGPYSYTWTPNTNISSTTAQSPTVTPAVSTTYTVTLSDGCSPAVTDQVTISLYNLPNPQASADTLSLCIIPSQPITFYNATDTTNGMLNPAAVIWNFGDGSTSTSPWDTISHTYTQPGTYVVTMTVSSMPSQGGCTVTKTVIPQINIYALPVADFTSNPNPTSMFEPEVQFTDQSQGLINQHFWDFAGLDSSSYPNPIYSFPDSTNGDYPVKLTVTDIHECVDTITKMVKIKGEFGIYIPNAFTPDFDFKNDQFGPQGFGISAEDYRFMIFDRWGEKLFDTDILFKPWNGFYKGNRVQEGVYVWKLFFKDINGKKHERVGHVTIIQ
ncbi:MAG: PKD domain-containing protein [Flavobacteriales bacterium]|nr:MAG: PKD domain-containing protein [Flavobacteriales bacterium]